MKPLEHSSFEELAFVDQQRDVLAGARRSPQQLVQRSSRAASPPPLAGRRARDMYSRISSKLTRGFGEGRR